MNYPPPVTVKIPRSVPAFILACREDTLWQNTRRRLKIKRKTHDGTGTVTRKLEPYEVEQPENKCVFCKNHIARNKHRWYAIHLPQRLSGQDWWNFYVCEDFTACEYREAVRT